MKEETNEVYPLLPKAERQTGKSLSCRQKMSRESISGMTPQPKSAQSAPPTLKLRLDYSMGLAVGIATLLFVILPPERSALWAVVWIAALTAAAIYPVLHFCYWIIRKQRIAYAVTAILLMTMAAGLTYRIWPRSVLSITLTVAPTYQDGTDVEGMKWKGGFQAVTLAIDDKSEYPIQDLDLTVQALNRSGDLLGGMVQLSHIAGVEFHPPDPPDLHLQLWGKNGLPYDISTRDMFYHLPGGSLPFGEYWKIYCARLPPGIQLRVMIQAGNLKQHTAPAKLRVFGTCEIISNDGMRIAQFDQVVNVTR